MCYVIMCVCYLGPYTYNGPSISLRSPFFLPSPGKAFEESSWVIIFSHAGMHLLPVQTP